MKNRNVNRSKNITGALMAVWAFAVCPVLAFLLNTYLSR